MATRALLKPVLAIRFPPPPFMLPPRAQHVDQSLAASAAHPVPAPSLPPRAQHVDQSLAANAAHPVPADVQLRDEGPASDAAHKRRNALIGDAVVW